MKILSDYETARSLAAIEAVGRLGKRVAEVGDRKYNPDEVEDLGLDIRRCLSLAGESEVKGYIHVYGSDRVSFGFFSFTWVPSALRFLTDTSLPEYHRDWISGLLFGYAPASIDAYLSSTGAFAGSDATSPPFDDDGTAGTSHPCSGRFRTHSPTTGRFQILD